MNKQEVIEKIEKLKGLTIKEKNLSLDIEMIPKGDVLEFIEQIDEPEKPVIPKYVADWIEWCKKHKVTLLGAVIAICDNKNIRSLDASGWATKNQETFTKAWFYGYEVEKEKQYVVAIPDDGRDGFIQLWKNREGKLLFNFEDKIRYGRVHLLTEKEIKQKDERLWKFAEEVKE